MHGYRIYRNPSFNLTINSNDSAYLDALDILLFDLPEYEGCETASYFTFNSHIEYNAAVKVSDKLTIHEEGVGGGVLFAIEHAGCALTSKVDFETGVFDISIQCMGNEISPILMRASIFSSVRYYYLNRGWFFLHASWLRGVNRNIMVSGKAMSGKTTLSMVLLETGKFQLESDDQLFVSCKDGHCELKGLPSRLGLRENAQKQWAEISSSGYQHYDKRRVQPKDVKVSDFSYADKNVILFPKYEEGRQLELEPINEDQAIQVINESIGAKTKGFAMSIAQKGRVEDVFFSMYGLLKASELYRLYYDDTQVPEMGGFLLSKWGNK